MAKPLITVVTPVYNGRDTIAECIESVLAQTHGDLEYLVQDNCSTDGTRDIIESYARRDSRIRVQRNPELVGVGPNHERAYRRMSPDSRYVKVVHADDWIFPECLEKMSALADAHPSVTVVSAYRLEQEYVTLDGLPYPSTVVPGRDVCRLSLLGRVYVFGTPTSILVPSAIIRAREPFYDQADFPRHWDTAICYELLRNGDLGFVHEVLTFTRRTGSTQTTYSLEIGSNLPEHIRILKRYGPVFLAEEEYRARLRQLVTNYYRFLGASLLRRPGREFWKYHEEQLDTLGLAHGRPRLLLATASVIGGSLFHPFRAYGRTMHPEIDGP